MKENKAQFFRLMLSLLGWAFLSAMAVGFVILSTEPMVEGSFLATEVVAIIASLLYAPLAVYTHGYVVCFYRATKESKLPNLSSSEIEQQ